MMTRIILTVLLACLAMPAQAQFYKCKRADGTSTFQDNECPDGTTATKLAMPTIVAAQSLTLTPDSLGHFRTQVSINSVSVVGLVDTGASMLSISAATARSMGISQTGGKLGRILTANGYVNIYIKSLPVIRIGNIEIYNIDVSISDISPTLIGMSALKKFKINEENGQLVLIKK